MTILIIEIRLIARPVAFSESLYMERSGSAAGKRTIPRTSPISTLITASVRASDFMRAIFPRPMALPIITLGGRGHGNDDNLKVLIKGRCHRIGGNGVCGKVAEDGCLHWNRNAP